MEPTPKTTGRPLALEWPVEVVSVPERRFDDREDQQLTGLDRGERARRNPVMNRIEGDRREEATPLRHHLVARLRIRVEVKIEVETLAWHLGDRVDLVEDVLPERLDALGSRKQTPHPDDGDIDGAVCPRASARRRFSGDGQPSQALGPALRDLSMQRLDGAQVFLQGRDLSHHVQPFGPLLLIGPRDESPARRACLRTTHALRGHSETTEVASLERVTNLVRGPTRGEEPGAAPRESDRRRGCGRTGRDDPDPSPGALSSRTDPPRLESRER